MSGHCATRLFLRRVSHLHQSCPVGLLAIHPQLLSPSFLPPAGPSTSHSFYHPNGCSLCSSPFTPLCHSPHPSSPPLTGTSATTYLFLLISMLASQPSFQRAARVVFKNTSMNNSTSLFDTFNGSPHHTHTFYPKSLGWLVRTHLV